MQARVIFNHVRERQIGRDANNIVNKTCHPQALGQHGIAP
jgi:hypothetical protein